MVPATTATGQYPVTVTDAGGHTATAQLTVFKATFVGYAVARDLGQPISMTGSGWPSDDSLNACLVAGTSFNFVCSVSVDSTGAIAQSCPVPTSLPHASYRLSVQDTSLAGSVALTVDAGIVTTVTNGQPLAQASAGTSMLLNGGGFRSQLHDLQTDVGDTHDCSFTRHCHQQRGHLQRRPMDGAVRPARDLCADGQGRRRQLSHVHLRRHLTQRVRPVS